MLNLRLSKLICIFSCILLSGCLAGVPSKSTEKLHDEVKTYGKLIRWRAYDDAAAYVVRRDDQAVNINSELLKEIRVTKYEVLSVQLDEEKSEAQVVAEISYYHERVNNVHTIQDMQLWWQDEESGRWHLDGQLPDFKP